MPNQIKTDKISVAFFVSPKRGDVVVDALKSLLDCNTIPKDIYCYFNPFIESEELKNAISFCEQNQINIIVSDQYTSLSKLFNNFIDNSKGSFSLICNDDIIFEDKDCIDMILHQHSLGHHIVKGTEAFSAFSISKRLVNTIGYFDENFTWAWEDTDYRLRMKKFGLEPFEILPNPIKHLRCSFGRNEGYWDQSSEYFFQKWNIAKLLVGLGYLDKERELNAQEIRNLHFSGFFQDQFYENLSNKVELRRQEL